MNSPYEYTLNLNIFTMDTLFVPRDYFSQAIVDNVIYAFDTAEWAWSANFLAEIDDTEYEYLQSMNTYPFTLMLTGARDSLKDLVYLTNLADELGYFDLIKSVYEKYYFKHAPDGTLCGILNRESPELMFSKESYRYIVFEYLISRDQLLKYSSTISTCVLVYQSFMDYIIAIAVSISILGVLFHIDHILSGENVVYFDYSAAFASAISEKELSSWDDIMHITSILFFLFGWFSYSYGIIHSIYAVEISMLLIFIPFFTYALLLMPFFLLVDYCCSFMNYLRGAASSSSFLIEFVFDYVTLFAFFMRNYVQNVRFLIILLVSYGINELIIYIDYPKTYFNDMQKVILDTLQSNYSFKCVSYEIYWFITRNYMHMLYELAHTFFLTVVQLSSFLIMVFWLFSFLYTYFSIETQESLFVVLRRMRAQQWDFNIKYRNY